MKANCASKGVGLTHRCARYSRVKVNYGCTCVIARIVAFPKIGRKEWLGRAELEEWQEMSNKGVCNREPQRRRLD